MKSGIQRVAAGVALMVFVSGATAIGVAAPAAPRTVTVKMLEFKYDPKDIAVKPGKVVFDLRNAGVVEHNFVIPKVKVNSGLVKPGQTKKVEATLPAGRYELICDVPGHKEAGMVGTVVVK